MEKRAHLQLPAIALLGLVLFVAGFMLPTKSSAQSCPPGTIGNCMNMYITDMWCAYGCFCETSSCFSCCQVTRYQCTEPNQNFYTARE